MIVAGLRIEIGGFWACEISRKFPGTSFRLIDIHPSKKEDSRGILEARGRFDASAITSFLGSADGVSRVSVLEHGKDMLLVSIGFSHGKLAPVIIDSGVHIRPPLSLENGSISVNVFGTEKEVVGFLSSAKKLPGVRVSLAKKSRLGIFKKPLLTAQQERTLKAALESGYYSVPRRIGIRALAKKLGLSASTAAEHLRKAESKVIEDYF